jgi:hypothetical protein
MDDNTNGNILVDNVPPDNSSSPLQQVIQAISNLILPSNKELISLLRTPTPVKISRVFTISAAGNLGGSLAAPDLSQIVWTSPMSSESWLHRITITSPEHGPASPIITPAQLVLMTSQGQTVLALPEIASTYQVAPTQFIEGRMSAPHLSPGESLTVSGDGLPASHHLRIDLQIALVQGVSEYTPKQMSPTDLTARIGATAGLA